MRKKSGRPPNQPRLAEARPPTIGEARPGQATIPSGLLVLVSGIRVARLRKNVILRKKSENLRINPDPD